MCREKTLFSLDPVHACKVVQSTQGMELQRKEEKKRNKNLKIKPIDDDSKTQDVY